MTKISKLDRDAGDDLGGGATVKSAARALDILELISKYGDEPVSFREIGETLSIPKSSLSKLMKCLAQRGWVEGSKSGSQYRLGSKVMTLIGSVDISRSLDLAIGMALEEIRDEFNETATFYTRVGDEAEVTKTVHSRQSLLLTLRPGARAPLYALSPGKIFLAEMSAAALSEYLDRTQAKAFTPATIVKRTALRKQLADVRRDGVAFAREEFSRGIWGVAVPLRIDEAVVGAINVAIPVVRHSVELEHKVSLFIQSAAQRLGAAFSSSGKPVRTRPKDRGDPRLA